MNVRQKEVGMNIPSQLYCSSDPSGAITGNDNFPGLFVVAELPVKMTTAHKCHTTLQ